MKKLQLLLTALLMMVTTAQAQDFKFDEVTYTPQQTTFRLFAPTDAKKVVVRIYKDGQGGKALKTIKMTQKDGLWTATADGDLMNKFYTFDMGRGECPGVFAKAVGVNGKRGAIIDKEKTFPEHWCCDEHPVIKSPADLVIYELHHRDFSIARPDAKYPGKYLALTEPWAIEHLKSLGVNAVHILPSYDYGSVDETRLSDNKYNWGYDPVNYNVPEGGYSTNPYDPYCRIREFKEMVNALHEAGIAVILDVVYNHTYDIEHSNFQRTYPDYYYRKTADGKYSNGSGCGNETASEKPMMRQFMIESVKYWYNEYRVDGFRFDLMGCHDIETMNAIRSELNKLNPSILIYHDDWRDALGNDTDLTGSACRQVDDAPLDVWAAIRDAHDDTFAVSGIGHFKHRTEGVGSVGTGQTVVVHPFSAGSLSPRKFQGIVRSLSFLRLRRGMSNE